MYDQHETIIPRHYRVAGYKSYGHRNNKQTNKQKNQQQQQFSSVESICALTAGSGDETLQTHVGSFFFVHTLNAYLGNSASIRHFEIFPRY